MWCVLSESGGPKVVCGLALAVKPSARLLSPSSLWLLWPLHHFLRNSVSAHCFFIFCSLCSGGDHIVPCVFCCDPFTFISTATKIPTPHSGKAVTRA